MSDDEGYVTVEEAARLLGLSTRQVNRYGKGDKPLLRTRKQERRILYLRADVEELAQSSPIEQVRPRRSQEGCDQDLRIGVNLRPLKELASEFSVSYHTLRDAAKDGRLKAEKLGPIYIASHQAVERYLASRRPRRRTKS